MKKSLRTRQYIIEKTAPVFNVQGFQGTSLTALQEATGLTKGSLYGNFSDKEEIAREVFRYSMKETRRVVLTLMESKETAKEKLTALLSFYAAYVFNSPIPGGCPLLNNAVEADDFHQSFKKIVSYEIQQTIQSIATIIDEGKKRGEFKKHVNSMDLAYIFFTSIEGAIMVSRVSSSDRAMKIVIRHCKSILDQIILK